jgi:hypothetical protein
VSAEQRDDRCGLLVELAGQGQGVSVVPAHGTTVVIDQHAANADPELAVLSAMAHGRDADAGTALKIALVAAAARVGLDAERSIHQSGQRRGNLGGIVQDSQATLGGLGSRATLLGRPAAAATGAWQ